MSGTSVYLSGEKNFGFLIPYDDANTCLVSYLIRERDMEERAG